MIPEVKAARRVAAITSRSLAIAIARWVAWCLLLHVVIVAALRRVEVVVAFWRKPWPFFLKVDEPRCISWIVQEEPDRSVPRVCVDGAPVDPHRGAGRGGSSHLHLLVQHLFVVHWTVLRPTRCIAFTFCVAPKHVAPVTFVHDPGLK